MSSTKCLQTQYPSSPILFKVEEPSEQPKVMEMSSMPVTIQRERKAKRIATLLAGYMRDNLTPSEHDELDEWVGASDKNMRLFEELTDERKVALALELLNDKTPLVRKLTCGEFKFKSSLWCKIKQFSRNLFT